MLGKSGVKSYLTFSRIKKLEDATLLIKLNLILEHAPLFAMMAGFRLGSLSVIMVWDSLSYFKILSLTLDLYFCG